jgi:hypothetical protein
MKYVRTTEQKVRTAVPEASPGTLNRPFRAKIIRALQTVKDDEHGLGTLEIVIIIAVLLAVALIFRENLMSFASSLIAKVFNFSVLDGL